MAPRTRPNIWYMAPTHQVVDPSFLLLTRTPASTPPPLRCSRSRRHDILSLFTRRTPARTRQRRRKIPEIFLDFPKPRTEKSPSTSIARGAVSSVLTQGRENAGRCGSTVLQERPHRRALRPLLKFPISIPASARSAPISKFINNSWIGLNFPFSSADFRPRA